MSIGTLPKFKTVLGVLVAAFFLFLPGKIAWAETSPSRAALEAELQNIEAQISDLQNVLSTTKTQKKQLSAQIAKLQAEGTALRKQIQSTAQVIDTLEVKLTATENSISAATSKIARLKIELTALLRDLNQQTNSLLLSLSENNGLSSAFAEYQGVRTLSSSISSIVVSLEDTKQKLGHDQEVFSSQQSDARNLLSIKTLAQRALLDKLTEENKLLIDTKGKESTVQSQLADTQKRAAEIRNRIYSLFEATRTVTFGQAVDIAQTVQNATGVRAAFLLGILTQESNLGQNVGTCNRAGDPPEKSWRVIMKPERDQEPFKTITGELGLDIDTTPVSCPMKDKNGKQIGWGGAMGPAQFIPSTWMGYRSKVTALTGNATANPWDIRDAFFAAGIKLRDGGATNGVGGEWRAAMLYFSGSTNPQFRFYGDNVAKLAAKYQQDIDTLK